MHKNNLEYCHSLFRVKRSLRKRVTNVVDIKPKCQRNRVYSAKSPAPPSLLHRFPSEPYCKKADPDSQTATEQEEHAKATISLDASTRRGSRVPR